MKKFLLALCLVLVFAVTAVAEEAALPAVNVTVAGEAVEVTGDVMQPALNTEAELTDSVTVTLTKSAEGVWNVTGVAVSGTAAEATAEDAVALELVTPAGVCEGVETVVTLEAAAASVVVYTADDLTKADVTVTASGVAAAMGEEYAVGDLKATTVTFTTVDGVTSVKVAFDIVKPAAEETAEDATEEETVAETVYVYYVDGVDGEVLFPALKYSAQVGDPTPAYDGVDPVREDYEFAGWGPVDPFVKGETIYEAQWRQWFTVTYYDEYTGKLLAEFEVLEGDPTPVLDPNDYTYNSSFTNMGFTPAVASVVTGDVTYTLIQMIGPRQNNFNGVFKCVCSTNSEDHNRELGYMTAGYMIIDTAVPTYDQVYFDGTNYKGLVVFTNEMERLTNYYHNSRLNGKGKHSEHVYLGRSADAVSVTYDFVTDRWVVDDTVEFYFACPTTPVINDTTFTQNNSKTLVAVKGTVGGKTKTMKCAPIAGTYSVSITGSYAAGEWNATVTINDLAPYVVAFESKYGVDVELDAAKTGTITFSYKYTLKYHGLVANDGYYWEMQEANTVKWNGKPVYVNVVEE